MDNTVRAMREKELKLMIIVNNKACRLDQAFAKTQVPPEKKRQFREKLLDYSIALMAKIDDNTITTADIRQKIRDLTAIDGRISYGQAQKVLNISLKQYCFITNKIDLIQELDCPYDLYSEEMDHVNEAAYVHYQTQLEQEKGIKILKDLEHDDNRISNFLA
jgi:Ni2+-binding GTPase involved in maturation of urease and hydrogenase